MSPVVTIYTDGAARGNPGPGGYGVVLLSGQHHREISAGYSFTTNNRMELLAVIVALETLKIEQSEVTIFTDSQYVVNAVNKGWLNDWVKKRFKGKKNQDLWLRYLDIAQKHRVKFIWIRGHNDNPWNERCDKLAVAASMGKDLAEDSGYIQE
jgi:ribonuclease HI